MARSGRMTRRRSLVSKYFSPLDSLARRGPRRPDRSKLGGCTPIRHRQSHWKWPPAKAINAEPARQPRDCWFDCCGFDGADGNRTHDPLLAKHNRAHSRTCAPVSCGAPPCQMCAVVRRFATAATRGGTRRPKGSSGDPGSATSKRPQTPTSRGLRVQTLAEEIARAAGYPGIPGRRQARVGVILTLRGRPGPFLDRMGRCHVGAGCLPNPLAETPGLLSLWPHAAPHRIVQTYFNIRCESARALGAPEPRRR